MTEPRRCPPTPPPPLRAELCEADAEYAAACEQLTPVMRALGHEVRSADFFRSPKL